MPANQSLGVGRSRRLDTAVRQIDVATGRLVLTGPDNLSETLVAGATKNYSPPQAGVLAYAPDGSRFHVVYETDPANAEESRNRPGSGKKRASSSRKKQAPKQRTRRASSTAKAKSTRASSSKSKPKARSRGKKA